jgi:hypothetical protein
MEDEDSGPEHGLASQKNLPLRWCEKIGLRQGGRAGVSEKLYSGTFFRFHDEVQKPCHVAYL